MPFEGRDPCLGGKISRRASLRRGHIVIPSIRKAFRLQRSRSEQSCVRRAGGKCNRYGSSQEIAKYFCTGRLMRDCAQNFGVPAEEDLRSDSAPLARWIGVPWHGSLAVKRSSQAEFLYGDIRKNYENQSST